MPFSTESTVTIKALDPGAAITAIRDAAEAARA